MRTKDEIKTDMDKIKKDAGAKLDKLREEMYISETGFAPGDTIVCGSKTFHIKEFDGSLHFDSGFKGVLEDSDYLMTKEELPHGRWALIGLKAVNE